MAEILSKFVCVQLIYPWKEWMDGKARRATQGRDYSCKTSSFISILHKHGERNGMKVETSQPKPNVVDFRFFKPHAVAKRRSAKRRLSK